MEYLLSIIDNIGAGFFTICLLSGIATLGGIFWMYIAKASLGASDIENENTSAWRNFDSGRKFGKVCATIFVITLIVSILTPTRESLIKARIMMVGSEYVTKGQIDKFIQAVDNKVDKTIDAMASDKPVKVDINVDEEE